MSSDLMQFGFEGHDVRVHIEGSDELWFVAFDICRVLSLTNVSKAVSRLLPNECRDITFSDVTGRLQEMKCVNEQGLYRLIFRSNKPEAERFQNLVFGEILPTIRKTGRYEVKPQIQPMSALDRVAATRSWLELGDEFGLTDDLTRMLAREAIQNGLREVGNPYGQQQLLLPGPGVASEYFTIEQLRGEFRSLTDKQWMTLRGTFGKVCRLTIQAADPDCEPLKTTKYVNGEERRVNMWPIHHRDIAIAAIESHIKKVVVTN